MDKFDDMERPTKAAKCEEDLCNMRKARAQDLRMLVILSTLIAQPSMLVALFK